MKVSEYLLFALENSFFFAIMFPEFSDLLDLEDCQDFYTLTKTNLRYMKIEHENRNNGKSKFEINYSRSQTGITSKT